MSTLEELEKDRDDTEVLGVGTAMDSGEDIAAMDTIRRGLAISRRS